MNNRIPVAKPSFTGNERKYIDDCMETGWISSAGKYVDLFERSFAEYCGVKHAIGCCNGTVALHLALLAFGVKPDDEVLVPTLTFIATPNAVAHCGARPVFVDSEPETWNIDPSDIENKITERTKGIIAVHLYGHPANMSELRDIARRHNLFVIEDAAEAHGATYDGRRVGSVGDAAIFSFYANKIITMGEGGVVVTDDDEVAKTARVLRGQGMDPERRYWHPIIGYNYRLMNLPAAIGLAQLEQIDERIEDRKRISSLYRERLGKLPGLTWQAEQSWSGHVNWMFSVILDPGHGPNRDEVIQRLDAHGIETRPVFYPAHSMPAYAAAASGEKFPVAERIAANGISLPTWSGLSEVQIDAVCQALSDCISR